MKRIIIIGASGFGKEVAWVIARMSAASSRLVPIGFCDDAPDKQTGSFAGLPLLGSVEQAAATLPGCRFLCAIGNNRARQQVTARALAAGMLPESVIDPTAVIAPDARLEAGVYIGIGSIVSTGAVVGSGVLVNHHACIGHDACLADFTQLCPGARVSGGCALGEGALMGTNATLIPRRRMGAWSTLAAGTTAFADLPEGATIVRLR